jgi:hypothetical protein
MQMYQPLAIAPPLNRATSRLPGQAFWDKFKDTATLDYKVAPVAVVSGENPLQRVAIVTARKTDVFCTRRKKVVQHIPTGKEESTSADIRLDGKLIAIGKKNAICLHELEDKTLLRKF